MSFDLRSRSRIKGCFRALDKFTSNMGRLLHKRCCGCGRGRRESLQGVGEDHNDNDDEYDDIERFQRLACSAASGAKNNYDNNDNNIGQEVPIS